MSGPKIRRLDWTPALVGKFWDGVANTRGLAQQSFGRLGGRHLLQAVRWHLRPGQRHLDFGGGDGDFAALLAEAGFPVAVYEPSAERAARVAARLGGKLGFLGTIGDEEAQPFDAIFLVEVIEHVLEADLPALLARLDRLLAPGGRLIVTTPNAEDLEENYAYEPVQGVLFHRWQHQRAFTRSTLSALLGGQGFVPRVVHEVELTDRIFAERGAGLGSRPDYANLFNTDRPLTVGDGQSLVWIGGRNGEIEPEDTADGALQRWRLARADLVAETRLVLPVSTEPPLLKAKRSRQVELVLTPEVIEAGDGWLYSAFLPKLAAAKNLPQSDSTETPKGSRVALFEDGVLLGPAHSMHEAIRTLGQGRYSHWGEGLFFAASDNSDPRQNGRRYTLRWTPAPSVLARFVALFARPSSRRFRVPAEAMQPVSGRAFRIDLPAGLPQGDSDEDGRESTLRIYEEHLLLGPPHAPLDRITVEGRGRYCHRRDVVHFSASDETDPRRNGRRYVLEW